MSRAVRTGVPPPRGVGREWRGPPGIHILSPGTTPAALAGNVSVAEALANAQEVADREMRKAGYY